VSWLALLFTFQQALWIDVPFIRQDKNGCGSASIAMVMKYWQPDKDVDVDSVQRLLFSEKAGGIYARDMAKYFEAHGYRVFTFGGAWTDLEEHVSKGRPLIVSLEGSGRGALLHYVVVAGVDSVSDLVLLNDPADRKLVSMPHKQFEEAWRATGHWTLLALPELDLAAKSFREEDLAATREHLDSALRVNPGNTYANDFLATVYYLQNNTEAALKYWNRAGKPEIENIRIDPPLRTDRILLDRALAFSRGSTLRASDFETTQARLAALGVFSRFRLDLSPGEGENFDVTLRAAERSGADFLSWARGLPFQTLSPAFINIAGKALNISSMFRWDSNKRRASATLDSPLRGNPSRGLRVTLDGRDENWTGTDGTFRMKKVSAAASIRGVAGGRWSWSSGGAVSVRRFSNDFARGAGLKYSASVTRTLVKDPTKSLELTSAVVLEAGKLWAAQPMRFGKLLSNSQLRWGSVNTELRLGRAIGQLPFDERFTVGFDRDSDLWLRAHSSLIDGQKNAANSSRGFVLLNSGFQKPVWNAGWFSVASGPFLDAGKQSTLREWLVDAGVEVRFRLLGSFTVNVSYARSLSDSRHNFFLSEPRM